MKQIFAPNYAVVQSNAETFTLNHPTTIFTDNDVVVEIADTEESLNYKIAGLDTTKLPFIPNEGEPYEYLKIYRYGDNKVKCLQEHIRMHYTPEETPNLWLIIPTVSEGYPAWVQPTGTHDSYKVGDRVVFDGKNYESLIDANVWSPTVYPAGWKEI